jgi:hypothetical protein
MSGNKVMGKVYSDNNPNKVSIIDITVDKTGLSINLLSISLNFRLTSWQEWINQPHLKE